MGHEFSMEVSSTHVMCLSGFTFHSWSHCYGVASNVQLVKYLTFIWMSYSGSN